MQVLIENDETFSEIGYNLRSIWLFCTNLCHFQAIRKPQSAIRRSAAGFIGCVRNKICRKKGSIDQLNGVADILHRDRLLTLSPLAVQSPVHGGIGGDLKPGATAEL